MTLAQALPTGEAMEAVTATIASMLDGLDSRTRLVCGYHLGYWNADGSPPATPGSGGGKALRARLAILSARAAGADADRGVPAAVAVELVHNFSLLHDDVMDGDRVRRHRPTAWAVYGVPAAILAGDAMLAMAGEALGAVGGADASHAVRYLYADVRRLIVGQSADLLFERRQQVSVEECLSMATDKTGALLSCAASLGAVLCAGPDALTLALARYGRQLGLAFQLVDDLLGIWGAPTSTGKPVLSDLRARKKSAPVAYALASGGTAATALAALYGSAHLTESELDMTAALIERSGARGWARRQADSAVADATAALSDVQMPPDVRAELFRVAHFVTARDH